MKPCDSCGAPVTWASTEGRPGKPSRRIPLDRDPVDGDDRSAAPYRLQPRGDGSFLAVWVPDAEREHCPHQLHRTHFQTCPNAARHRRRT